MIGGVKDPREMSGLDCAQSISVILQDSEVSGERMGNRDCLKLGSYRLSLISRRGSHAYIGAHWRLCLPLIPTLI